MQARPLAPSRTGGILRTQAPRRGTRLDRGWTGKACGRAGLRIKPAGTARRVHLRDRPERSGTPARRDNAMRRQKGVKRLQVFVRDNNVDQALRVLKKKMQREGVFREMKRKRFFEKPSERATREKAEAVRRRRKLARKQAVREGLVAAPKKRIVAAGSKFRAGAPSHGTTGPAARG
jgi:small subunit ribosomal protein S21